MSTDLSGDIQIALGNRSVREARRAHMFHEPAARPTLLDNYPGVRPVDRDTVGQFAVSAAIAVARSGADEITRPMVRTGAPVATHAATASPVSAPSLRVGI